VVKNNMATSSYGPTGQNGMQGSTGYTSSKSMPPQRFKKGDIVISRNIDTSHIQEYEVIAVPGDHEYDTKGFFEPDNGGMLVVAIGRSPISVDWVEQDDFIMTRSAPVQPVIDLSKVFDYKEPEEPEFDDNCTTECTTGDHRCGK
jgi:hypothetical protein